MAVFGDAPAGGLTRRRLLEQMAAMGGTAMLLAGMDALGFGIGSARAAPPKLQGKPGRRRVLVLGGGEAGLVSALELSRTGYDVTLVEARAFPGGRAQTARRGVQLTELGGTLETCTFDEGLSINIGPWRIPYHHRSTLHYTRELGVPLELFNNDNDASYLYFEKGTGPLAGKPIRKGQIAADMAGHSSDILAKLTRQGALDAQMDAAGREMFTDYLVSSGYLSKKDLDYTGTAGRGFDIMPGAGTNPGPGRPSAPFVLSDMLHSNAWRVLASVTGWTQQRTMFQPVNGMEQIPKAMARAIPAGVIRYSTEVTRIRQSPDEVIVDVVGPGGQPGTLTADWCVCTIPLPVLKTIDSDFPLEFKAAMGQCAYAPVGKIGLQMKRRFWEEDHMIYGGHVYTDNSEIGSISMPSTGWQSRKGVLLGYYQFDASAVKVSAKTPEQRAQFALDFGQKIFPEYRESYESSFSVAWHRMKYNLGGWGVWRDEARATAYPLLCKPDRRLWLAGEHMSYLGGWQAGAIESAWQQIEGLHARAMSA